MRVAGRLADSFLGCGCWCGGLGGVARCTGFSESRRRLGLTVDRWCRGSYWGAPFRQVAR